MRKRRGEKRRGSMDLPSKIGVFSNGRPNASSSPYFRPVSRPGLAAGFARINERARGGGKRKTGIERKRTRFFSSFQKKRNEGYECFDEIE